MSEDTTPSDNGSFVEQTKIRQAAAGLVQYVEDNPLAAIAGALIIGIILARFAFLGNPKDD